MKDYSMDADSQKNYIVDFYEAPNRTLTVVYADGTHFTNIANTQENVNRIAEIQEAQAHKAVGNISFFDKMYRRANAWLATSAGVSVTGGISAAKFLLEGDQHPLRYLVSVGALLLLTFVPASVYLHRAEGKKTELHKIKYRDEHRTQLDSFTQYPNALAGLRDKRHFVTCARQGCDPYSILSVDDYSQEDLETIVQNIERENQGGFAYQKRRGQ